MGSTSAIGPGAIGAVRVSLAAVLLLALFLWAGTAEALAKPDTYFQIGLFGKAAPGSGEEEFNLPHEAAVEDATGNLFVVDSANNRVEVFKPSGKTAAFLTEFGAGTLSDPYGIAIDQNSGAIYVSDSGNERIVKFESNGAATPTYSVDGSFASPSQGSCGGPVTCAGQIGNFAAPLAVDPTNGDLVVGDPGNAVVDRYEADGTFVSAFDGSTAPLGSLSSLSSVAVDADGDVVVGHDNRVDEFSADGSHQFGLPFAINGETREQFANNWVGGGPIVSFDPNSGYTLVAYGSLFAVDPEEMTHVAAYDGSSLISATALAVGGGFSGGREPGGVAGLAVDGGLGVASGRLYAVASQAFSCCGTNGVFVLEPGTSPAPTMAVPSGIGATEVHLAGTVNPNGSDTRWRFEVSSDGQHWHGTPVPDGDAGSGNAPVPVSAAIDWLQPSTTYRVRLVAESEVAKRTTAVQEFTTPEGPPTVHMLGAAPVLDTSARLNARVNPNGLATTYHFEYGSDSSYGSSVPAGQDGDAGNGREPVLVSGQISGLRPGATYHYRLVAQSSAGTSTGPDTTFVTRTAAEIERPQRGVELVNQPDKGQQNLFGTIALSASGNRAFWGVPGGTPTATNGGNALFVAERTAGGWVSKSLVPPADEQIGGGYQYYLPQAWSPELSNFIVYGHQGLLAVSPYAYATIDSSGKQHSIHEFEPSGTTPTAYPDRDFNHVVVVNVTEPLAPGHVPGTANDYEFHDGEPELLDLMPDGSVPACGDKAFGFGYDRIAETDASQFYFATSGDNCSEPVRVYVRHRDDNTTTAISGPPLTGGESDSFFVRTTPDGNSALFVTSNRLDPADTNTTGDIYRYTRGQGVECLTCVVSNAAVTYNGFNGGDQLVAASDDLNYIYFTSPNVLEPGQGSQGAENLYALHDGKVRYVSPSGTSRGSSLRLTFFSLSEDGKDLFFRSDKAGITSDDNGGLAQVYRYDYPTDSIECISCPRGKAATAESQGSTDDQGLIGDGPLSADGDTYVFETNQALVRQDVNGENDVYEWHNGSVGLVTDGKTVWPSGSGYLRLVGISANGADVAFTTSAHLTGYERDGMSQLFVARTGGGFGPPPAPPAPCDGDACQGPLQAAPGLTDPGSASIVGPGNAKAENRAKRKPHKKRHPKQGRKAHRGKAHARHAGHGKRGGK